MLVWTLVYNFIRLVHTSDILFSDKICKLFWSQQQYFHLNVKTDRFLNQTSTTTCILNKLFLRYNQQLQTSKCRIVFLLSFILFSFLSHLPPWKNRVAGLPVNTGCNYGQQCRGAINLYGSMHKAQECKLKVGKLMK